MKDVTMLPRCEKYTQTHSTKFIYQFVFHKLSLFRFQHNNMELFDMSSNLESIHPYLHTIVPGSHFLKIHNFLRYTQKICKDTLSCNVKEGKHFFLLDPPT